MKKKFYLTALAVLTAGAMLLAGCGAEPPPSSTPSVTSAVPLKQPATYLYRLKMENTGESTNSETELQHLERSQKAFEELEEKCDLMLMDAYNYHADGEGTPRYAQKTLQYPAEIDPNGKCIRVNDCYLAEHPVETVGGQELEGYSDTTLFLLVPEKYRRMEADILKAYQEDFYFEKVTMENGYNGMASRPERSTLTMDDLTVHITYIKNGQKFYTYRPEDCAVKDGGWVTDPIIKVYSGNIHCAYTHNFLFERSCYFGSEKATPEEAYQEILPVLTQTGMQKNIQQVELVDQG